MINIIMDHPDYALSAIQKATSDCGRVEFQHGFGEYLKIDGRLVSRGYIVDQATGRETPEEVEAAIWDVACALKREVKAYNKRVSDDVRNQGFARQAARDEAELAALDRTGWEF